MNNSAKFIEFLFFFNLSYSCCQRPAVSTCRTPDNKIGRCINIRKCPQLITLLQTNATNSLVVQFLRNSQCGKIGNNPKVCCSTGIPYIPCSSNVKICGEPEISEKIITGEGVNLGEYPWMVALGYKKKSYPGPEWICGGSLINDRFVLSASHCVYKVYPWELFTVRLGDVNLNDSEIDGASPVNIPVEYTIIHENYTYFPIKNDIALIKLRYPVKFNNFIKPICLPIAQELQVNTLKNQIAYVAGWGKKSSDSQSTFFPYLQDLQMPILDINICKQSYKAMPRSYIDHRNICAGYVEGKKDTCQGDSGGPLMWVNPQDSKYYLVGIVSYGYKCAVAGYPGVYTRVSAYVDWIKLNIN